MSTRDLKGLYSALLVAFDENGNINEKGLRQIVRHNIDVCKMDGLYVGGSTGENFMLSTEEKKRIFEIAKDEAKDDITLIAQVGSINLKESVELAKFVTDLGYDAISAVTPFYYKFSFVCHLFFQCFILIRNRRKTMGRTAMFRYQCLKHSRI